MTIYFACSTFFLAPYNNIPSKARSFLSTLCWKRDIYIYIYIYIEREREREKERERAAVAVQPDTQQGQTTVTCQSAHISRNLVIRIHAKHTLNIFRINGGHQSQHLCIYEFLNFIAEFISVTCYMQITVQNINILPRFY